MANLTWQTLLQTDPWVAELIEWERDRQHQHLELIASENFASAAVRAAQGSMLTNKYAEGLPGKRYYGSCEIGATTGILVAQLRQGTNQYGSRLQQQVQRIWRDWLESLGEQ